MYTAAVHAWTAGTRRAAAAMTEQQNFGQVRRQLRSLNTDMVLST